MKALVISGGGSKGAFAGGVAEYLIKECGNNYDLMVGSSAGSLLIPHLAIGNVEKIKKICTSVTQEDIFNVSPFHTRDTNGGGYLKSLNQFTILRNILKGHLTFGESENLRKLIFSSMTREDFEKIRTLNKKVIVTVSNFTRQRVEYFNSDECNYEEFCNWIWASANAVPYMSIYENDGCQYADGGFGNHIPINCALENNVSEMDVIVLETENEERKQPIARNPFILLMQTISFMSNQISLKDRIIGELLGTKRHIDINIYFTPRQLTENPFIFKPELLTQWWQEGLEYARNNAPVRFCNHPVAISKGKIVIV
jgi:predicted patatin/cPLA2 family phospholipase